ncbi:MAG: carboxypeptidase regulatory-like domain-containing protein, partial [Acidobacteria bacterium]|nr:carboxypeptidase regulatory-like domain-containing protein [Acidobacteriota bacterium]
MMKRLCFTLVAAAAVLCAQGDPRGAIFGHVSDPAAAFVAGAKVKVTNTLTNVTTELMTNEQGYYEAPLLVAGTYKVEVNAAGFKGATRPAFDLPAGSRLEVDFRLEIGTLSDSVTVSDAPPLLNTDNASAGLVLDRQNVRELPWPGGNPMMLVWMAPGAQTSLSISDYSQRLHSGGPANNVNINGKVGGNEFTVDGASNNANGRGVGFNPAPEFVQAVKVETSGFDASFGHSTGASITMMTNSGTNQFHGVLREMHEQYKWRAADLFVKQGYYTRIAQAEAAGDKAAADAIRKTSPLQPGRENSYAASIGGPIIIPKLFNGKDKLFFFYGFAGFRVGEYRQSYYQFPTEDMRNGNFSQLLNINANQYQIYDPLSTIADASRPGHVVRTPFAGNMVPQSRIINPAYSWMRGYLPKPNAVGAPNVEPSRNFNAYSYPYQEKFDSHVNRFDYNISSSDRVFFRWSYNRWQNQNPNWQYYTDSANIWQGAGQIRTNYGQALDWVHNFGTSTLLDVAVSSNMYKQENITPAASTLTPSAVGYPTYLDQKVAGAPNLPAVNWSGWTGFSLPASPSNTKYRVLSFKADL